MTLPSAQEGRPPRGPAPEIASAGSTAMVPQATDLSLYVDTYAVIVETTDLKHRRRVYLSLHSAEKAADRARAAGHRAELFLVRMTPVGGESR